MTNAGFKGFASVGSPGLLGQSGIMALASGEAAIPREHCNSAGITTSSGRLLLTFWQAVKTETCTQIRVASGSTLAAATPTLVRMGVYSVDGSGNVALIAACASDTALFASTNTGYTRSLNGSFSKVAGQIYATGIIVVTGAATPTFIGRSVMGGSSAVDTTTYPPISAVVNGQSDLPTSVAVGSLVANTSQQYSAVLP